MADKGKGKRKIIVREQKEIHKGTNGNGRDYVIYQVVATTEGGVPIDQNLRSFQQLPKNQVIEVDIERFESDRFGTSYTVSTKKTGGEAVGKRIEGLERQLAELTSRVAALEANGGARIGAAPPAATAQPAPSPGAQQPPPLPGEGSVPGGNDDIPF